jgi:hypothetical protein
MRDLGSPVHHKLFFTRMFEQFGEQVRLFVVRDDHQAVGGLVCLFFRDTVTVPWASSLRRASSKCPNNMLYWEALEYACERDYRRFDFGRSSVDSGPMRLRSSGGPSRCKSTGSCLVRAPERKSMAFAAHEAKYKIVIEAWKRLPVPVTIILGPAIRRYLTN